MAKKKKTGSRRTVGAKSKGVSLLEFARSHVGAGDGEPANEEGLINKGLGNFVEHMTEIGQSIPSEERVWESATRHLSEVVTYHVEWNMMNPSALRDARRLVPTEFRQALAREGKNIREEGADPGDMRTILRLNELHELLNSMIPNDAWERVTDQLAQNQLDGKKGKRRWEGVREEDKGCVAPFLVVNYMLHSYCSAVNDRLRDVGGMDPHEIREEMLKRGDIYVAVVAMTAAATGVESRLTTTQYAQTEDGAYNRAELQAARLRLDDTYVDVKVDKVVPIAEGCEVQQEGDGWVAQEPSGQAEGTGPTKEAAVQDLRMRILTRLTADLKERTESGAN